MELVLIDTWQCCCLFVPAAWMMVDELEREGEKMASFSQ